MAEATTVATPYTTDAGAVKDRIDALTKTVSEGYKNIPSVQDTLAKKTYEEEGFIQPTAEARGKMLQTLMEHDKAVAENYANKNSSTFIENPMARSAIQNAQEAPLWGTISSLGSDIATRRALLGDAITRAMEAKKMEMASQQTELDNLWKTLGLYQTQEDKKKEAEKLTYQDAGDKIVGLNAKGQIVVTIPKGTPGDASTQALLDSIKKDSIATKSTGTTTTTAGGETTISPEEAAKQALKQKYASMTPAQKKAFLTQKMNSGIPLTTDELNDLTKLNAGQNTGPDLSSALSKLNINPNALTTKPSTGLNLGGTSGLSGLNLGSINSTGNLF